MSKENELIAYLEANCKCYKCEHKIVVDGSTNAITGETKYNVAFCKEKGVECNMETASLCQTIALQQRIIELMAEDIHKRNLNLEVDKILSHYTQKAKEEMNA